HAIDGHDLVPYLHQIPEFSRPQTLLTHFPHGGSRNNHFSIYHEGDWKLIYNFVDESYELYHLATDLSESHDLADQEPERLARMAGQLVAELIEKDALLPYNPEKQSGEQVVLPVVKSK